jgi:hypothetical protein
VLDIKTKLCLDLKLGMEFLGFELGNELGSNLGLRLGTEIGLFGMELGIAPSETARTETGNRD